MRRWIWMLVVTALAPPAWADDVTYEQTYDVERGAWLEIDCPTGTITIDSWEQARVELVATHDADVEVRSRQVRGDVQAGSVTKKGWDEPVEYEVRVPIWMNVGIAGRQTEVEIRGVQGEIEVETVEGDVYVKGSGTSTILRSVKGDVRLEGAEGSVDLESTNGEVTIIDSKGELIVSAVNGDVRCENVVSSMVEAETVNGDIFFDGTLDDDGDYYFTTHIGDIELNVPREVNLAVTVVSYRGDFNTDFEIQAAPEERRGFDQRRWSLDIGAATGKLRIESFQGDIDLYSSKRGRGKRG